VLVIVGFAVSAAISAASLFVLERPILDRVTRRRTAATRTLTPIPTN